MAIVEIDETRIDHTLQILHNVDPTGEIPDPLELAPLEEHVQQMGPLIDQELEQIDRRHAQLTRLGSELVDALNMYHNLMRGQPLMNSPYQQPPQQMMNKLPGGPPSLTNFQPQPGMMPGYSPYYDPNNVPQMMNHQAILRPPHSAPPQNMYGGVQQPQQMMMNGPQMGQPQQMPPSMNGQNMGQHMPQMPQVNQPGMGQMPLQQQPQQQQQHHHHQVPPQQLPPQQQQQMMNNVHQVPPPGSQNNIQQMNSMPPQGMLPHQGY